MKLPVKRGRPDGSGCFFLFLFQVVFIAFIRFVRLFLKPFFICFIRRLFLNPFFPFLRHLLNFPRSILGFFLFYFLDKFGFILCNFFLRLCLSFLSRFCLSVFLRGLLILRFLPGFLLLRWFFFNLGRFLLRSFLR